MSIFRSVIFATLLAISTSSFAASGDKGQDIPFPWGTEVPFPWQDISGMWISNDDGRISHFHFQVIRNHGNERQLRIFEIDPLTREVLTSGVGYEVNRIVRAVMAGRRTAFRINVRAYKDLINEKSYTATVLSVRPINSSDWVSHSILKKLDNDCSWPSRRENTESCRSQH